MAAELRTDGTGLIAIDPWLEPYADRLRTRWSHYQRQLERILAHSGSLEAFASGHRYFGFQRGVHNGQPGVWFREWAPAAIAVALIGDFNEWDRYAHPLHRGPAGVWSRFLPDDDFAESLTHGSRVKVHVHSAIGPRDRIPTYIQRAVADPHTRDYAGQYWQPETPYAWQHAAPPRPGGLRIYETHIGMATEELRVGTFAEFTRDVLPRIAAGGYNALQVMAIQEHPYYGSFGYQVSNFYAASSRFGTPEELKALIDTAHELGLTVLLDLVHSHAVKNLNEGLNHFDGTEYQYFHAGDRGAHPAWDSLCFDYGKLEVLQFLLSNVRFWLEEYRFDGFRFDGVTSMMYRDHGMGRAFSSYDDYFPPHVDEDAIVYLQLANELVHRLRPDAVTIAEEVSGMVGTARPVCEGGLGFDYRLAMGIPDYWIKLLKEQRDEEWQLDALYHTLTNRRAGEAHVAYAESHDQALVGDKTIAMWLMDADIYYHMTKSSRNLVIERGVALHKLIRLITFTAGGEAYLNFMGNEFGHPEWVDFPRAGNGFSYQYARRQWSLADDPDLRYHALGEFDRAMLVLDGRYSVLSAAPLERLHVHEGQKVLAFRRGPLLCAFNFHPTDAVTGHRIGVPEPRDYRLVLSSDNPAFGGHGHIVEPQIYPVQPLPWDHRGYSVQIYLPPRTAIVLVADEN